MEKRYKAQVSVEMLVLVGIVVLGGIIFATFYLSSVNRNIDKTTDLDVDFTNLIGDENMGSFPSLDSNNGDINGVGPGLNCGNNVVDFLEQCDPPASTALCTSLPGSFTGGTATCTATCTWNLSSCVGAPVCGDGFFDSFNEVCDYDNAAGSILYNSSYDCSTNPDYISGVVGPFINGGAITCTACDVDYTGCDYNPGTLHDFMLKLEPTIASANIDAPRSTNLGIDFNGSTWVDVNVSVESFDSFSNGYLGSDKCEYDNVTVPIVQNGIFVHRFLSTNSNEEYIKNVSCSENNIYKFTFVGVDNNGTIDQKELIFTVPQEPAHLFALCKDQTNAEGTISNWCINYLSGTETNAEGSVTFFVNQPDNLEYSGLSPICQTSGNGTICFSLGFT